MWSGETSTQFFGEGDTQQKGKIQIFWLAGRLPQFFFLLGHAGLPIRKTLRRVLDLLTVMILKRLTESIFFQINEVTASLKIKKRWQILWYGIQSTEDYSSISR